MAFLQSRKYSCQKILKTKNQTTYSPGRDIYRITSAYEHQSLHPHCRTSYKITSPIHRCNLHNSSSPPKTQPSQKYHTEWQRYNGESGPPCNPYSSSANERLAHKQGPAHPAEAFQTNIEQRKNHPRYAQEHSMNKCILHFYFQANQCPPAPAIQASGFHQKAPDRSQRTSLDSRKTTFPWQIYHCQHQNQPQLHPENQRSKSNGIKIYYIFWLRA